jgi:hypothetical protein
MRKTHNESSLKSEFKDKYNEILYETSTPIPMNDRFHQNFHSSHTKFQIDASSQTRIHPANAKLLHEPKHSAKENIVNNKAQ